MITVILWSYAAVEVGCLHIEQAVADNRQGVVLQFGGWGLIIPHRKKEPC